MLVERCTISGGSFRKNGKDYAYDILDVRLKKKGIQLTSVKTDGSPGLTSNTMTSRTPSSERMVTNIEDNSNNKSQLSVTLDEDYMSAVNSGDIEIAQRLVLNDTPFLEGRSGITSCINSIHTYKK